MTGSVAHPLLISLANLLMDFRTKATNHAFHLLAPSSQQDSFTRTEKYVAFSKIV